LEVTALLSNASNYLVVLVGQWQGWYLPKRWVEACDMLGKTTSSSDINGECQGALDAKTVLF